MKPKRRNFLLAAIAGIPGIGLLGSKAAPVDAASQDFSEQLFMRPAWVEAGKGQVGHVQLFNPSDSGVEAKLLTIKVGPCPEFHIGYGSGGMFPDSNFIENGDDRSHGLPMDPNERQQRAKCRSRFVITSEKKPIGFGQLGNIRNPNSLTVLDEPYILAPGRSLIIRSRHSLCASFFWSEEADRSFEGKRRTF